MNPFNEFDFTKAGHEDFPEFTAQLKQRFVSHFRILNENASPEIVEHARQLAWKIYKSGAVDGLTIAMKLVEKRYSNENGIGLN